MVLHGEIDEGIAYETVRKLMYLSVLNTEPITILLNTVGGNVYDGLFIYDTIRDLVFKGVEVNIEVRGLAASMGLIILQAATKRVSSKYTRFLIHEMSDICHGKTSQIEDETAEAKKLNDMLRGIEAIRSKKTSEEIEALTKRRDIWLSAEEALEWGLIDSIV